jgi:hypothetical protein
MIEVLDKIVIAVGAGAGIGLILFMLWALYQFALRDPFMFWTGTVLVAVLLCLLRFCIWVDGRFF